MKMRMMAITSLLPLLGMSVLNAQQESNLEDIRAFHQVDDKLASSGFVTDEQFGFISEAGFKHVISLLPGDGTHEDSVVRANGMTFTHIPVQWGNPTMKDLEAYMDDMNKHQAEKVYLHCQANMRASAFLFLYRVIGLGTDKKKAKPALDSIWYPTGTWHRFIGDGLKHYGLDPEYRFEPAFVRLIREEGTDAAMEEMEDMLVNRGNLDFTETDLENLAHEFYMNNDKNKAADVYAMNARAFPASWEAQEDLGEIMEESGNTKEAVDAFRKVTALNPEYVWAKRMLGKLGVRAFDVYWTGIKYSPVEVMKLTGTYGFDDAYIDVTVDDGVLFIQPSWSRDRYELHADGPDRYFVHENNWNFEFTPDTPGELIFKTSNGSYTGHRTE